MLDKLSYYWRIYRKIIFQDIKTKMSYRSDFIISMIGIIVTNVAGFISFWIIFKNFPKIGSWNYYQMLFFYGFSLITLTPMQCLFDNNWNLRLNVFTGDFIKYCFRPINLFFYYMSEIFDVKGLGQLLCGIAAVGYSWHKLSLGFDLLILLKLILMVISASLIMISLMNIAASTCFYLLNSGYVMVTMFKFADYIRYPLNIYNKVAKFIFTLLIPIGFSSYYPSLVLLLKDPPLISYFTPLAGIVFFYISYKLWMRGAMNYSGTGS